MMEKEREREEKKKENMKKEVAPSGAFFSFSQGD